MKIYISRSNNVDLDLLILVRFRLRQFDGVEILEHTGGNYNPELITKANLVLVLTESSHISDENYVLGKGIYSEIIKAGERGISTFLVAGTIKNTITGNPMDFIAKSIASTTLLKTNTWSKYASASVGCIFNYDRVIIGYLKDNTPKQIIADYESGLYINPRNEQVLKTEHIKVGTSKVNLLLITAGRKLKQL